MIRLLSTLDQAVGATRPGWRWLGEMSLVLLGVHLAADRVDDAVLRGLSAAGWLGPDGSPAGAWIALGLELLVATRVAWVLLLSAGADAPTWQSYKQHFSVESVVRPLFWVPTSAAGAWVLGMAIEDATAPYIGAGAFWLGLLGAGLAVWRLGWTPLRRLIGGLLPPKHRTDGIAWAPLLLGIAGFAAWYGLPIWGLW
ncbi:MAG: hypothetical protein KC912_05135 [Proteobacteria bacterium]|nr:hypothetical protein [Pseudomonadota bacterium]